MVELPTIQEPPATEPIATAGPVGNLKQASGHPMVREVWLRLGLLATPPVAVVLAMLAGMAVLPLTRRPLHPTEMLWAALVVVAVGWLAVLPMVIMVGRGAIMLLRCAMVANMTRLVGSALGAVIVLVTAHPGLHKIVLILWLAAFYFVLLIAESFTSSWVIKNSSVRPVAG